MVLRAATVHEDSIFVLERLCQLSPAAAGLNRFCQLKDIIDLSSDNRRRFNPLQTEKLAL